MKEGNDPFDPTVERRKLTFSIPKYRSPGVSLYHSAAASLPPFAVPPVPPGVERPFEPGVLGVAEFPHFRRNAIHAGDVRALLSTSYLYSIQRGTDRVRG